MGKIRNKLKSKMHDAVHAKPDRKFVCIFVVWAFVVTLIVETLSRFQSNGAVTGGFMGGLKAIYEQPFTFAYAVLLMMTMLSLALFFKRRYFVMSVISVLWIGMAVADFALLSYRVTPFAPVEFTLIDAALGVLTKYFSVPMLIFFAALIVIGFVLLVFCWRKAPKAQGLNRFRSFLVLLVLVLVTLLTTVFGLYTNRLATYFPNLADAYLDYGFVYTFLNGIDMGIHKPKDYSSEKVAEIVGSTMPEEEQETEEATESEAPEEEEAEPNTTDPNVIFLQLESFFDLTEVEALELSEDPVPYFRSLVEQYSSGYLSVPVIGAGTANTEFEVMTGINLDFFGAGEYPYKTILRTHTCESTAYNLKEVGYATHAIHNNRANFYTRNEIFSQLGFDDFTTLELMDVPEEAYTPNGWAKDAVLTDEIIEVLESTENRDYIYCISVQGHGKYPTEEVLEDPEIEVTGGVEDEDRQNAIEYYANQTKEMDEFLQALVEALEALDEPTVLVVYGDHLPGLGFTEDDLTNENMYQTQYVIWDNCGWEKEDEDIEAYQLSSRVLERLGVKNGVINAFHQTYKDEDEATYQEDLQILSYDILYGDMTATGGEEYTPTNLKYGVTNVEITSVEQDPDDEAYIIIKGENFTQFSRVMTGELTLDDEEQQEELDALDIDVDATAYLEGWADRYDQSLQTEFIDENTLRAYLPEYEDGDTIPIVVMQKYKSKLTLQISNVEEITLTSDEDSHYGEDYQDNNENYGDGDASDDEADDEADNDNAEDADDDTAQ